MKKILSYFTCAALVGLVFMGFSACGNPCASEHDFGAWSVTTNPTCAAQGVETRVCSRDSSHKETRPIASLGGHLFSPAITAECGKAGAEVCSRCGDTRVIPALNHEGGEADCITGEICSHCGDEYGEPDAHNHKGYEYKNTVQPTCEAGGYDVYECACGDIEHRNFIAAAGHSGGTATCTDKAVCDNCEHEYGEPDANNHRGGTATCVSKAICGDCLNEYGEVDSNNHSGGSATCVDKAICDDCGHEYGELEPHNHADYTQTGTAEPTCTEEGYEIWTCACGDVEHRNFVSSTWHEGGTATCIHEAICDTCGEVYGGLDPANHKGHTHMGTVAPTCEDEGYDIYECDCGDIEHRNGIPALGHDYDGALKAVYFGSDEQICEVNCNACHWIERDDVTGEHDFYWYLERTNTGGYALYLEMTLALSVDLTIYSGESFTISGWGELIIPQGVTLTSYGYIINDGAIRVLGTFINYGTVSGHGEVDGSITNLIDPAFAFGLLNIDVFEGAVIITVKNYIEDVSGDTITEAEFSIAYGDEQDLIDFINAQFGTNFADWDNEKEPGTYDVYDELLGYVSLSCYKYLPGDKIADGKEIKLEIIAYGGFTEAKIVVRL